MCDPVGVGCAAGRRFPGVSERSAPQPLATVYDPAGVTEPANGIPHPPGSARLRSAKPETRIPKPDPRLEFQGCRSEALLSPWLPSLTPAGVTEPANGIPHRPGSARLRSAKPETRIPKPDSRPLFIWGIALCTGVWYFSGIHVGAGRAGPPGGAGPPAGPSVDTPSESRSHAFRHALRGAQSARPRPVCVVRVSQVGRPRSTCAAERQEVDGRCPGPRRRPPQPRRSAAVVSARHEGRINLLWRCRPGRTRTSNPGYPAKEGEFGGEWAKGVCRRAWSSRRRSSPAQPEPRSPLCLRPRPGLSGWGLRCGRACGICFIYCSDQFECLATLDVTRWETVSHYKLHRRTRASRML